MSLYDIIDEITDKNITKTETGDTLVHGVMLGIVAKNYDSQMPGRVCVTIPTRDKDAGELQWARQAQLSSGKSWGHYFLPEVGDQVLLAFEGGNIEKPYIIGCVPKDNNKFLTGSVDQHNQVKRIVTKNGSKISFEDNAQGEGDKDKILVETAKQLHTVFMDNENNLIRISDKEKGNMIEMKTQDGQILVKAKSKLTIEVGDKIKIIMNGESGALKIEAQDITVEAQNNMTHKATSNLKSEAAQIMQSANGMLKAESSGVVKIAGTPIQIG